MQFLRHFFGSSGRTSGSAARFQIVKSRKEVLKTLISAQTLGLAVGLYCPALADGLLLAGVEDISNTHGEEVITLKPYDMNGILIHRTQIAISEIRSACAFGTPYRNPLLTREERLDSVGA